MGRVNPFYALCFFFILISSAFADAPVEVISGGTRYKSIEAYKAVGNELKLAFPQEISQDKPAISDKTVKQWLSVGYEHGMKRVLSDFKQDWNNPIPSFQVPSDQLEERIRSLVEGRKEPVLFVSGDKKLRVLGLGEDEGTAPDPQ